MSNLFSGSAHSQYPQALSSGPAEEPFNQTRAGISTTQHSRRGGIPQEETASTTLLETLGLPDDVLDFIQIPLGYYKQCRGFIVEIHRSRSSVPVAWFEEAAEEAVKSGDIVLMQQCIQRRVIVSQCEHDTNYLDLLIKRDQTVTQHFYQACNTIAAAIKNKTKRRPSYNKNSLSQASTQQYSSIPGFSSGVYTAAPYGSQASGAPYNAGSAEGSTYSSRYPIAPGPFDMPGAGQPGTSPPQVVDLTWQPISAVDKPNQNTLPPESERYPTLQSANSSSFPYQSQTFSQGETHRLPYQGQKPPQIDSSTLPHQRLQPGSQPISSVQDPSRRPSNTNPPTRMPRRNSQSINSFPSSRGRRPKNRTRTNSQPEDDLASLLSTTAAEIGYKVSGKSFGEPLDPKYKVQENGKLFFIEGRVFAMMYPEPKGESRPGKSGNRNQLDTGPDDSEVYVIGKHGEKIYSHIKRFVVIRERKGHCLCLPINSYRGTGVGKKGIPPDEKSAHAIIYDSRNKPTDPILPGEEDLVKNPIAVDMNQKSSLAETSRIHFGKIYTIEWNVKVFGLGHIAADSEEDVEEYWRAELLSR
jgi:hypothetical protein